MDAPPSNPNAVQPRALISSRYTCVGEWGFPTTDPCIWA